VSNLLVEHMADVIEEAGSDGVRAQEVYPWLRPTAADLAGLEFEAPIAGSEAADCSELTDLYRVASQAFAAPPGATDTPTARIWDMLWALTSLHFKPADINEPFGPMLVLLDGSRSATPSDFRGHIDMLADMAENTSNLVLKARLSDVCWLLDRKRAALGQSALSTYAEIVQKIGAGELRFSVAIDDDGFRHETHDYLLRALGIARTIGWDKPEALNARRLVVDLRKRAVNARALMPVHWFCSLDLQFAVSDPADVAVDIDEILARPPADTNVHAMLGLWRLAARAYHQAKRVDDKHRCQSAAAELLIAKANATKSAMLASQFIGNAIAELHGVPGAKDRRLELRHLLIDRQANISDEMSTFSQAVDLSELARKIHDAFSTLSLLDSLFVFAMVDASPKPEDLEREAIEAIRKHPLSFLFGSAHLDDEGKVIHRTNGASSFGDADGPVIHQQIAQNERVRRNVVATGKIEPARQITVSQHYVSDDVLERNSG
jgi:hypothetical protein